MADSRVSSALVPMPVVHLILPMQEAERLLFRRRLVLGIEAFLSQPKLYCPVLQCQANRIRRYPLPRHHSTLHNYRAKILRRATCPPRPQYTGQ